MSAIYQYGELSNLSVYLYDDPGDRVWKLTGNETLMQINGETTYSNVNFEKTLYTSPYLVMTEEEYTKHYFIEGERVCSKVGGGFGPAQIPPTHPPLEFIYGDEDEIAERLNHMVHRQIYCTDYSGGWDFSEILEPAYDMGNHYEELQYFYHPDHLGSSSFITERHGAAEQHLQYLPFGELWVSQRNTTYDTRYKFSAKELDSESGYNYFGARYYDSELSNWLSVDPMADDFPGWTPYHYCHNNPVNLNDPYGLDTVPSNMSNNQWHNFDVNNDVVKTPVVNVTEKKNKTRHGLNVWFPGGGKDVYDRKGISDGTFNMEGSMLSLWNPLSPLSNALVIKSLLNKFGIGNKKNKPPIPDKDGYTTGDYEGDAHTLKRDEFPFRNTEDGTVRAYKGDSIFENEETGKWRINHDNKTNKYDE